MYVTSKINDVAFLRLHMSFPNRLLVFLSPPIFAIEPDHWKERRAPGSCNKQDKRHRFPDASYHHHHLSLDREGRWGTRDDFTSSFLHSSLFSTALWDFANSRPVHSLMLSSHLSLCLPFLLSPFTVPCKVVLARLDEREMTKPLQFASLYDGQEVFVWSDCLLDLCADFLVGNMVFV